MFNIKVPLHPYKHDRKVTISLAESQAVCLSGRNGCGKTTVLKILAGHLQLPCTQPLSNAVYIPAVPILLNGLSVKHQLEYYQTLNKKTVSLDWLQDQLSQPVESLSKGQAQMLSLMQLCYGKSQIWLLDEPFNALDQYACNAFSQIMDEYIHAGGTVLYSSHIQMRKSDRCISL